MIRKWIVTGAGLLWIALGIWSSAGNLWAAPQAATDQAKPGYSLAEYNQYQAADKEANPQQKVKALDDFVKAYPNSTLMPYIYRDYYTTYMALKNFAQAVEYADRMIALGDKIDTTGRLEAYYTRAQAFYLGMSDKTLQTPDALTKARDASLAGLKALDDLKKPDNVAADQFEQQKKGVKVLFNAVAALASTTMKDYPSAVGYYKTVLSITPEDPVTHYLLGIVYLQMTPPSGTDGFWELA